MSTHKQKESWLLAEAKNCFSELARSAIFDGPQKIIRRDGNVVVISEAYYFQLQGEKKDFKHFLLHETPNLIDLKLTRDNSPMRDIDL